jgi:hypothetical protein
LRTTAFTQLVIFLGLILTLSLVIPWVYGADPIIEEEPSTLATPSPDSSASSDPDLCLKVRGQKARATSQEELDSIPTPAQCMPSQNKEAKPPSTTTTPQSPSTCLSPFQLANLDFIYKKEVKRIEEREKCTVKSNGDMILTSKPDGNGDDKLVIQSIVSNNYGAGYHYGYENGLQEAKLGESFSAVSTGPDKFAKGFDTGYAEGYKMYTLIRILTEIHLLVSPPRHIDVIASNSNRCCFTSTDKNCNYCFC